MLRMRCWSIVLLLILGLTAAAWAASRRDTLLVVTEVGPNSMDIHGVGANRPTYGLS
jgi:peptide/nickel transport system substrate-binding protein